MNYAPIILFTYNRPVHTEETLLSLTENPEFKDSILYIYSDAAKDAASKEKVEKVRQFIYNFKEKNYCKDVNIIEAVQNKGLAKSIINGVSEVMSSHGRVIVLEDDCVVSTAFLKFMNTSLNAYKDNYTVGSITGFCPPIKIPKDYKSDVFLAERTSSWGWATWADRWNNIDWSKDVYRTMVKDLKLVRGFNRYGTDRFYRLCRQMKYDIQSWSVRFGANQYLQGYATVYPVKSLLRNSGVDGSGVHSEKTDKFNTDISNVVSKIELSDLDKKNIDKRIQREFYLLYSGGIIQRIARRIKIIPFLLEERKR